MIVGIATPQPLASAMADDRFDRLTVEQYEAMVVANLFAPDDRLDRAGLPVDWILNLPGRRLEVFDQPEGSDDRRVRVFGPGEVAPLVIWGGEVAEARVDDLLP